jgi:hypothetical protein
MPDPTLILEALAIAAVVAGLAVLAFGFPWRSPRPARAGVGWVIGLGGAFYLACHHMTGVWPHWPPRDGAERLLIIVLPAALLVELLAALPLVPRWLAWALRLMVAASTAPVLLYNTIYLASTGTPEWSSAEAAVILGGMAAALAAVWALLGLLLRLAPGRSVPFALSVVCAAAGAAIMLSGDFTDGRLGLPLAAALAGAAAASLAVCGAPGASAGLGIGLIGLFSLLVIGRLFAGLPTEHAILLGLAPLLCWLPELPYVRRVPLWARGLARLALVAAPLALVVVQAQQQFVKNSASPSTPGADEPTIEDYMNFGK